MGQRIYWVPHTACFMGCAHCHNDSSLPGQRATRELIDRIVAYLPRPESPYRLEEVLVGGGEALMRGAETEYLIRTLRERFPRGPQGAVAFSQPDSHKPAPAPAGSHGGLLKRFLRMAGRRGSCSPTYSFRSFTRFTHARTSASTVGNTALTSGTVMPGLMRGS